jgi:hypothetical protein
MQTRPLASLAILVICISAIALAKSPSLEPQGTVYVGFLDDAREQMVNWKKGVATQRVIRPAFERTSTGWARVEPGSLSSRVRWTIAFDGKDLGRVESESNNWGLTAFQTILTPAAAVPNVGQPSAQFAGLLGMTAKVRRPLVVVSQPYFRDPDGWKRTALPNEIAALVRQAFRRDFPHVGRCKDEEIVQRDWQFPDSALSLHVAYSSNKHSFLVEAGLDAGDCGYVDDPNDPLSAPWFFVSQGGVRRIGSFMALLDAGDYDNDGHSELVFFLTQPEDTDGFILYDAALRKRAELIWSYH